MHACMLISSIYIVITVYLYTTEIFELCTRQPAAGVWLVFFFNVDVCMSVYAYMYIKAQMNTDFSIRIFFWF